jgi:hypothetical protein
VSPIFLLIRFGDPIARRAFDGCFDAAAVQRADGLIAVRDDGTAWPSEKEMQTRVSHWLRDRERDRLFGAGTTLHGLRVSYAAWWRRNGASKPEVADLIGDVSEAMGGHYTRHVEAELNIIRAFDRIETGKKRRRRTDKA